MKRILLLLSVFLLAATNALAAEETPKSDLRANFKRVALEMSSTSVSNAEEYQNSPNSKLSADSETVIKGVFDFVLEYEQPDWQWNNSVFAEYGKTRLKQTDGETSSTENADKILLTSDYARKTWHYRDADVGPFASLGYQTEFTANDDAPRTKVIRGKGGLKLFNGTYIKELYAAGVIEEDLTYSDANTKYAYEIGIRAEYPLRDGIKFQLDSYYRDYIYFSRYQGTDFKYEFNFTSRMEVEVKDSFKIAPYIAYFQAQSREADVKGSNLMIGVSFGFSNLYDIF